MVDAIEYKAVDFFMQKYEMVYKLAPRDFKRLTGVTKTTFAEMASILRKAKTVMTSNGGKPSHLSTKDKLLMSLEYLREYRTYFHLGQSYGLSESACY